MAQEEWGHALDFAETVDRNHGRLEFRRCWVTSEIAWFDQRVLWKDLQTLVMIESERHVNGTMTLEHRYYLSSATGNASTFLDATRQHWSIENSLHWVLDVAFREDDARIRKGYGAENFAILRHIALNALKQEQTTTVGIQNKRLKAGWDHAYLEKVLAGMKT
jgi:predicted transposase YbfD/YdcC